MQGGGRSYRTPAADASKTPHPELTPALTEDPLLQRALDGEAVAAYSPGVIRALGRLVGNQAAQRMIQRAVGAISQSPESSIQRGRGKKGGAIDIDKVAQSIASGHAFSKHVQEEGLFPGVKDSKQFAAIISDVMFSGESRNLADGRIAYWKGGTLVIYNPDDADLGTCFKPDRGKSYFDALT